MNEPSDKSPNGARGRRVVLPTATAEEALPSLEGMCVGFKKDWDGHDARQKCGVITRAWIDGNALWVSGHLFGRDFPEVITAMEKPDIKMGMSYEMMDAHVADMRASTWTLTKVTFTGAAILLRDKAAYSKTTFTIEATGEVFTGRLTFAPEGEITVRLEAF